MAVVVTVVVAVVVGAAVVGMNLLYVALNPLEVRVWSDLKRTTIVLEVDTKDSGNFCAQNLPLKDQMLKMTLGNQIAETVASVNALARNLYNLISVLD